MAKRRQHHEEELPFVALMDTMTNVVGVLIIVLVMIGVSLANSVKKVMSELPEVSVPQLEQLLKKIADNTPKEDPKKIEDEMKKLEQQLKKDAEELKTMDLSAEKQNVKLMDLDDLQKQLEDRKKARNTKKEQVDKLLAEVDKLKALLDTTPVYQPPAATIVRLPNPKEIPKEAVMHRFLVTAGRVYYLNDEGFMETVLKELDKNQKLLVHSQVEVKDANGFTVMVKERGKDVPKTKTILDQQKISDHFAKLRIANRDLSLELVVTPNSPRIPMRLVPNPAGGETTADIKNPASVFQRLMRKLKSEPGSVVWFYVFKDSVETYLGARDVADAVGVPVGWEVYGNPYFQRNVQQYEVNYTPPKPQPPPPPGAVRIAPPKATVD
jgi:multidrug efflux pump subunit AcrA (membrane-fusion protein)